MNKAIDFSYELFNLKKIRGAFEATEAIISSLCDDHSDDDAEKWGHLEAIEAIIKKSQKDLDDVIESLEKAEGKPAQD